MAKAKAKAKPAFNAIADVVSIAPQPGPQTAFLSSSADIVIYGGGAGGGKSFALCLEPIRHCVGPKANPHFGAVIFRRNYAMVTMQGGLWDESAKFYPLLDAKSNQSELSWTFPSGAVVKFAHLQHEKSKYDYQGAQICLLCFDELTHFSETQFFYMMSRNRSTCGVRPYVRATCNPDADSWVAKFIAWWIDQETGFPIKERIGKVRWFVRVNDELVWADTAKELTDKYPALFPKSATFIPASVYDNQALLKQDPSYLANLMAQPTVERERLLKGNWKIRPAAGMFFKKEWFRTVDAIPAGSRLVRFWDRAATKAAPGKDPDWTVGLLLAWTPAGEFIIADVVRLQGSPLEVETAIYNTALRDGAGVLIGMSLDPAQAGKFEAASYSRKLTGFNVRFFDEGSEGNKQTRAKNPSAQAEAGNFCVLRAGWNDVVLGVLENFPEANHDDDVDALSGAYHLLTARTILTEENVG